MAQSLNGHDVVENAIIGEDNHEDHSSLDFGVARSVRVLGFLSVKDLRPQTPRYIRVRPGSQCPISAESFQLFAPQSLFGFFWPQFQIGFKTFRGLLEKRISSSLFLFSGRIRLIVYRPRLRFSIHSYLGLGKHTDESPGLQNQGLRVIRFDLQSFLSPGQSVPSRSLPQTNLADDAKRLNVLRIDRQRLLGVPHSPFGVVTK